VSHAGGIPVIHGREDVNFTRCSARAADRLDHLAHQLRRLHYAEFGKDWCHESLEETPL
jgi:hypothetical protein